MKQYEALTCHADRDALDILTAVASTLPITGIVDNDTSITLYFDEGEYNTTMIGTLQSWMPEGADLRVERGTVEEQNWNAEFEQSLQPVRLTDRLVITQSWNPVEPEGPDDLIVTIDPKMSFGTGHHESTRLIARLMPGIDFRDKRVLDIGTGTGVLAIIAKKYGAGHVVAIDNNEWAVENSRENIAMNDASDIILTLGELDAVLEDEFDIILANIHRNIIIELLPEMVKRLHAAPEACILTSGVLYADYDSLVEAVAEHGLKPVAEERENEWIATKFQRA
ncbi:MAG: 50S ribosomal protein L11 methyltransferase [Bacteroidota bacterium]